VAVDMELAQECRGTSRVQRNLQEELVLQKPPGYEPGKRCRLRTEAGTLEIRHSHPKLDSPHRCRPLYPEPVRKMPACSQETSGAAAMLPEAGAEREEKLEEWTRIWDFAQL
jgi:hypothetical protein